MDEIVAPVKDEVKVPQRSATTSARYVFWILYGISFLNYLDRFVMAGAVNAMGKELGFGLDRIGLLASAFLIVYTLAALPLGIWADRAKRTNVVTVCVAIWSVATALTALATNFFTLFLSRMVLGIGEAGYFPAGTALLSDYYRREKRSRIMSQWGTAQLFGILGGYAIGGALAGQYTGSWRLAFIITGIPGLLLAFLIWRVREPRRNQASEEAANLDPHSIQQAPEVQEISEHITTVPTGIVSQFSSLVRIKTLLVLIVMQIFAFFVLGVNTTFLPTYLQQNDTFKMHASQAGLYSGGVIVLAGVVGTLLGGYLADLLNRRYPGARVMVCGIGFLLAAPSFILAMVNHNLIVFTIFFVLTALLLTIYTGPSTAATQDIVPAMLRASAIALTLLVGHLIGDAFAPSLVGYLATMFDPTHGLHFQRGIAGQELGLALLVTCTPALVIAGLVGVFGARWMGKDIAQAEYIDKLTRDNVQ